MHSRISITNAPHGLSALSLATAVLIAGNGCGSAADDADDGATPGSASDRKLEIYCDLSTAPYEHCPCVSNGGAGQPRFKGSTCSLAFEHNEESPLICADTDYPKSGKCDYYTGGFWICNGSAHDCRCRFKTSELVGSMVTLECNNHGSGATHCCHDRYGCDCDTKACDASAVEVDDCSSYDTLGIDPPPRSCGAERREVRTCTFASSTSPPSGGCVNSSDCPGQCSVGTDTACCPVCGPSGACTTACCTSSGCF